MDHFCRQAGFTPHVTFRVTDSAAIHGLVRAGMGIAFIPAQSWWMRTMQDIHVLHIDEPSCQRMIGLA
jgi:DNA-binding transcriptional LysR family regulator